MNVVIFGTGALGELVHYYLTHDSPHRVVAFTVDAAYLQAPSFAGLPVVPFEELPGRFAPAEHGLVVALGYSDVNGVRAARFAEAGRAGYMLPGYVSSRAVVAGATLGANVLAFEGALVQPFAHVGNDVVLWSGAIVGHHSRVGDHAFLAPGATLAGHVTLGARSFVGARAAVRDGVSVGEGCVVGLGAAVVGDCAPGGVYVGVPARRVAEAGGATTI